MTTNNNRTEPTPGGTPMRISMLPVGDIRPYENNPRNNDHAVPYVKKSIQEFGFKVPIVIDNHGVIVCGHTRYKAALELGMAEVPCIVASDLTPKQIQAFRLADNKVSEFSSWDFSKLEMEIGDVETDFDLEDFGFFADMEQPGGGAGTMAPPQEESTPQEEDNLYTGRVITPIYEITGERPEVSTLIDGTRAQSLLEEIDRTPGLPDAVREFLRISAMRHYVLHFDKIAEYYAQAEPQVQRLMENSCLVIIDYNKAIELGYVRMSAALGEEYAREWVGREDEGEDDEDLEPEGDTGL